VNAGRTTPRECRHVPPDLRLVRRAV